jgi:hypothetical protein
MIKDDIIRMAHKCGLCSEDGRDSDSVIIAKHLEQFANLVAAAEREACASLEIEVVVPTKDYSSMTPLDCYEAALMDQAMAFRAAIRARGQQ